MVERSAMTLASVMSGLAIQNQSHARLMQFVSGLNGALVKRIAVTAKTTHPVSVVPGRRSHQHSMVVRSARPILLRMATVIPPSVFAFQPQFAARFLAKVTGQIGPCAMQRLQIRAATSVAEAPRARHMLSLKRHNLEARSVPRKMAARNTRIVVSAGALSIARVSGQLGENAVQRAVEAVSLELSKF